MTIDDRSDIARRMEKIGLAGNDLEAGHPDLPKDPWQPRWKIGNKYIEFECGCVAERCRELRGAKNFDPIIFKDLPQQAVYLKVCQRHGPGMNKYVALGYPGLTFEQWTKTRRAGLMGRLN